MPRIFFYAQECMKFLVIFVQISQNFVSMDRIALICFERQRLFWKHDFSEKSEINESSTSSSKKKGNRLESAIQRLAQNALNVATSHGEEENSNEGTRQEPPRKEPGKAVEDLLMSEESLDSDEVFSRYACTCFGLHYYLRNHYLLSRGGGGRSH